MTHSPPQLPSPSSAPARSASPPPRICSSRGLEPLILEAGPTVGASVRAWGHVRVFSPWEYNVDPAAAELLAASGWDAPAADAYPTGDEIVERYLEPLAARRARSRRRCI